MIAREVSRIRVSAVSRHLKVAGVQLDIDCPTSKLSQYASFLREVRKALPPELEISITALLDWFHNGTDIGKVIVEVDEFVPQFYDLSNPYGYDEGPAIAASIDARRWGPVFNRFRKRFRVGISTFGRARVVPRERVSTAGRLAIRFFHDLVPLDIATHRTFQLQATRNQTNELVLSYQATRKSTVGYNVLEPGDKVEFIITTPETIRAAVESARQMRGYLAGVVFFRWPTSNETLSMWPDEVLNAAGLSTQVHQVQNRIQVVNGRCVSVECVDVYVEGADPFSPKPVRYRIRSSARLEYFVPEANMPVAMTDPSLLELSLPPYCGRGRLYLGRAITDTRSEFTLEQQP